MLQNVKQSGRNLVINLEWCCQHRDDSGTLLAHKILATQKSELVKYPKTTFSPHVRRLHAYNLRYQKQDRFWIGWFRILTAQVDSSTCQLRKMISQTLGPDGWQFCWITGVKFNSMQSIIVWLLHITQFTVCATKNLTVFVANSPRYLEWSSMAAVSRALCELSTRIIFFIEIQRQGIILAPIFLCYGKM